MCLEVGKFKESRLPVKIGYCNDNFPRSQTGFVGRIDDVRWYDYALNASVVRGLYEGRTRK